MKQLSLTLPLPNSANTHWRHGRGITYLSKQGRNYREVVGVTLKRLKIEPMEGRLSVEVHIHPKDRRKIDIDNRIKPLLDALQYGWAFIDDNQIDELHVYRKQIIPGGQCFVKITELGV